MLGSFSELGRRRDAKPQRNVDSVASRVSPLFLAKGDATFENERTDVFRYERRWV
jgi:hypothetical protein